MAGTPNSVPPERAGGRPPWDVDEIVEGDRVKRPVEVAEGRSEEVEVRVGPIEDVGEGVAVAYTFDNPELGGDN